MDMMHHDKFHFKCCLKPLISALFWIGALLSLIFAWIAVNQGVAYGYESTVWFNTGILLALLAFGLKGSHGWHSWMRPGHGSCDQCSEKMVSEHPHEH